MPWTKKDYPVSMKNLPKAVREKAIEIANALLEEARMKEGIVIATAISRAKDWAVNHGKRAESKRSRSTDVKRHGEDRYVIPYNEKEWAIRKEGAVKVEKVFASKPEAVKKARQEARQANASLTIQKRTGKVQQRISYNPNRREKKVVAGKRV
ncbi:MAG TPA: DUF2188 domain-containing protein [Chryseosolibacter sp.]|nr:DUF2188 domain-containing protein [Chryseosolibacter sp.]